MHSSPKRRSMSHNFGTDGGEITMDQAFNAPIMAIPVRPCDWAPQGNGAAAVVLTPKTSSIASPTGRSGSAASG